MKNRFLSGISILITILGVCVTTYAAIDMTTSEGMSGLSGLVLFAVGIPAFFMTSALLSAVALVIEKKVLTSSPTIKGTKACLVLSAVIVLLFVGYIQIKS